MSSTPPNASGQHILQPPTGTRDFYPMELARLRFIQDAWRRTSITHGFQEIDGPTFEHLDLYTIKSGEGIVSELFSFERFQGEKRFALRPEFTPTLARLYASKAASLPKPTKWFWMQNCFRAERPQRGRLREFCQWNCDILGTEPIGSPEQEPEAMARMDAEIIATCVAGLEKLGLKPSDVRVKIGHRAAVVHMLAAGGCPAEKIDAGLAWLDTYLKVEEPKFKAAGGGLGLSAGAIDQLIGVLFKGAQGEPPPAARRVLELVSELGIGDWCVFDYSIVRGLAYYTGMVFEVHEASGAERAIAGGGRYDKLIELFGGPSTPAVGFGMGDVVLSLVLQDRGLMPSDKQIARELGLRPDVIVISNGSAENDAMVTPTLAALRRAGLHARRPYKATKNIGKLLKDAADQDAQYAMILEDEDKATIKDLDKNVQLPGKVTREQVAASPREFLPPGGLTA
ncbi:MAG: ATP phosphoribosyltransferase regulatory subunit [Phycisphaerales bacterium]|nr:ATP phosphoribosyltransferase regulatory subunit [Phycisphaerales bacterium]